jgi:type II secretory pathway pseudopilin PulG
MNRVFRQSGFTLVEIFVYLAILLFVSTGSTTLLLSLDDFIGQYKVETTLYRTSTTILEQVITAVREADSFDATNSVLNDSSIGALAVMDGGIETVVKKDLAGDITLTIDGVDKGSLLSGAATVNGFTVYKYNTAVGTLVRIKLELTATERSVTKSVTMYDAAIIRGDL